MIITSILQVRRHITGKEPCPRLYSEQHSWILPSGSIVHVLTRCPLWSLRGGHRELYHRFAIPSMMLKAGNFAENYSSLLTQHIPNSLEHGIPPCPIHTPQKALE